MSDPVVDEPAPQEKRFLVLVAALRLTQASDYTSKCHQKSLFLGTAFSSLSISKPRTDMTR